jgi:hypothetical protein
LRSHDNEAVIIGRDVDAIMVPAGVPVTLRAGKTGFITQALGGSFTVYVEGNLFRIAAGRYPSLNEWLLGQEELRKKVGFETAPWKEKITAAYLGNAMKAQTALSGADARFAVFFQPLIYYKDHLGAKEKPLCAEQGRPYYEEMRARVRSMRQERFPSLNFFDVSDIYDTERGDVFTDIIHTTQEGRTAMAVTICDRISADALRDMKRKGK